MRAVRNGLYGAGIPVENSKGEADAGQHEVNYRYSDALDTADNHVIVKHGGEGNRPATKGKSVTFMAKYDHRKAGSSSHVHQSCGQRTASPPSSTGRPARHVGPDEALPGRPACPCPRDHGLPGALRQQLQALLHRHVRADQGGLVGRQPHRRLPHLRLHTKAIRVECRIPGSDVNPYLACAALLAAGLAGIEQKLELEPEMKGDMYTAARASARSRTTCARRPIC
jgi:glutamine synthetase